MKVDYQKFPELRVAYIRHVGQYGPAIGEAFKKLFEWASQAGVVNCSTITLAAYWDDPEQTPPEECRADACVTIPDDFTPEPGSGIEVQTLPAGDYAMFLNYIYDMKDFPEIWRKVAKEEMPETGKEWDCRPCYEIYYNCGESNPLKKWIVDICVAVK